MLTIQSPQLEVSILPEVGGKVGRIRHRTTAQEILVEPRRPYQTLPDDSQWVDYDTSGMDDCFPNVDEGPCPAGPCKGTRLLQLGDSVRGVWHVLDASDRSVVLRRVGSNLPYVATKTVRLTDSRTLEFSYEVSNTGSLGFPYLWSAHPLFAVPGEFRLNLPGEDLSFTTFPAGTVSYRWPCFDQTDLATEWILRGRTLKVFVTDLPSARCELIAGNRRLRFHWTTERAPVVGLWFNNYGFPRGSSEPFRCIAVEPCTNPTDVLHHLPVSHYPCILPNATSRWSWTLGIE